MGKATTRWQSLAMDYLLSAIGSLTTGPFGPANTRQASLSPRQVKTAALSVDIAPRRREEIVTNEAQSAREDAAMLRLSSARFSAMAMLTVKA